jgi:hypothetical protein
LSRFSSDGTTAAIGALLKPGWVLAMCQCRRGRVHAKSGRIWHQRRRCSRFYLEGPLRCLPTNSRCRLERYVKLETASLVLTMSECTNATGSYEARMASTYTANLEGSGSSVALFSNVWR